LDDKITTSEVQFLPGFRNYARRLWRTRWRIEIEIFNSGHNFIDVGLKVSGVKVENLSCGRFGFGIISRTHPFKVFYSKAFHSQIMQFGFYLYLVPCNNFSDILRRRHCL